MWSGGGGVFAGSMLENGLEYVGEDMRLEWGRGGVAKEVEEGEGECGGF